MNVFQRSFNFDFQGKYSPTPNKGPWQVLFKSNGTHEVCYHLLTIILPHSRIEVIGSHEQLHG